MFPLADSEIHQRPDVPDGTYVLSLISHDYFFDQVRFYLYDRALAHIPPFFKLRLDVKNSISEVRPYVPGTPLNPPSSVLLPYPIVLIPREKSVYFVPPETFNLVTMMSNPMMLLMVLGGGMMLAMPYLMVGSGFPFQIVDRFAHGKFT